mgnify:CR=1 FL=1
MADDGERLMADFLAAHPEHRPGVATNAAGEACVRAVAALDAFMAWATAAHPQGFSVTLDDRFFPPAG